MGGLRIIAQRCPCHNAWRRAMVPCRWTHAVSRMVFPTTRPRRGVQGRFTRAKGRVEAAPAGARASWVAPVVRGPAHRERAGAHEAVQPRVAYLIPGARRFHLRAPRPCGPRVGPSCAGYESARRDTAARITWWSFLCCMAAIRKDDWSVMFCGPRWAGTKAGPCAPADQGPRT